MATRSGVYNLLNDYGDAGSETHNGTDPYWIIAVIRLGAPLSFDRKTQSSSSKDLSAGAVLRAVHPLIITDACQRITVTNNKSSHTKSMSMTLKPDNVNYLVEILPDDWVFAWMVNNRDDYESLLARIDQAAIDGDPDYVCNRFHDGLKFIGRIDDVYKDTSIVNTQTGQKNSSYNISCTGFRELESQLFYDYALATRDAGQGDFGWLARFGVSVDALFRENVARGPGKGLVNNVNLIIPTMLDLVLGHGPAKSGNIEVKAGNGEHRSATPQLDHPGADDPGYSYLVPISVGNLIGKNSQSKGIMSYADVLELWIGIQTYSKKSGQGMFAPDFDTNDTYQEHRKRTTTPLLGTFLPFMPDFANRPLWQIFQQYVNHTVNELYTALKTNEHGRIVPTIVFRQIPFTTDAFVPPQVTVDLETLPTYLPVPRNKVQRDLEVPHTKFLDMPRWHIPAALVKRVHVGRSNATRTNFIHIYGTSSYLTQGGTPLLNQMLNNKPVRDDVDIMRSGIRPYMTTVECWVDDTVGKVPGKWMSLVADWTIGSHLTLNGTIELYGVQAPMAEGDNVSFDGVIYHIMGITHSASMDSQGGNKQWSTTLQVTNGMRNTDNLQNTKATTEKDIHLGGTPIYPGFDKSDNTLNDPGLTVEHGHPTTGGDTEYKAQLSDFEEKSQLNPDDVKDDKERANLKNELSFEEGLAGKNLKDLL